MEKVKLGSKGYAVKKLQELLGITPADGIFGNGTLQKVKEWQKANGLTVDGIVGDKSWTLLLKQKNNGLDIYEACAKKIGCEVAALKAVKQVETGGKSAFIAPGKPAILFEGHIFWKQLKLRNIDPKKYLAGNSDILYEKWTKKYYKSGLAEYNRLEKARRINKYAADESASWGMFQIMGNNYKACGCKSVTEFVDKMCASEEDQLELTTNFILNNTTLKNALISKNWKRFAYYYNGPGYASNSYDKKLEQAYNKFKK